VDIRITQPAKKSDIINARQGWETTTHVPGEVASVWWQAQSQTEDAALL
jgi:hypothetical protein